MAIVWLMILGAAAGFIATRLMDFDLGLPQTIALGVVGALIGGFLLRLVMVASGLAAGLIGAVLGAVLIIWIYRQVTGPGD